MTREEMIMKRVQEHYDELINFGYDVFAVILQGSQNYDLDEYSEEYMSDIDTKAIIIPKFKDLISGRVPYSYTHIRENGEHIDIKDIRSMFEMFIKQNITYLELLVSDFYIVPDKYKNFFNELRSNADRIANINKALFLRAICGSAHSKFISMTKITPYSEEKIKKFGYDPKDLHYLIRYFYIEQEYLKGASLRDCIKLPAYYKEHLMKVKKGQAFTKEEAIAAAERFDNAVKIVVDTSIDHNAAFSVFDNEMINKLNDLCYTVLYTAIKEELLVEEIKNKGVD